HARRTVRINNQLRPMRNLFLVLVTLSGIGVNAVDQASAQVGEIRADIIFLASDHLEGRATGSPGEMLAAEYLASKFERLGLSPKGTDGWFQDFHFTTHPNPHDSTEVVEKRGRNVIGFLDAGAEQTVVVGAHYDHLGYGGNGSRSPGDSLIHNGADDNASGVAGLLEIARQITAARVQSNNILFIAFSGEELGLFGSKHFVNNPTVDLARVNYMLNLDMVGRLREALVVGGAGTSPVWVPLIESIEKTGFTVKIDSSGLGPSDHASFYLKDIPVLHFFTGQHADYHKPSDDSPLINFEGIQQVASLAVDVIQSLDEPAPIAFTKTRDQDPRRAAAFKVSLGVMPDYAFGGQGLRLDAVLDDRPAAKAGLEAGDVVVELGGTPVNDIYSYMEALSGFKRGDQAEIVVRRGEEEVRRQVEF
ncbi:MAG TPA: M20/M25/M40 family metallo-hydrolase, partial [Rhodothermia bacterium]|nr:M20/M25/M40 family metallo-hydrolase [Rhodothermia bacterium]